MSTRFANLLALVLLLVLGGVWLTLRAQPPRTPAGPQAALQAQGADPSGTGPKSAWAPAISSRPEAAGHRRVEDSAADDTLRGTLTVLEPDGRESVPGSARFLLHVLVRDEVEPVAVEVRMGRFELALAGRPDFRVDALVADGAACRFESERHAFPGDGALVLRARRLPLTTLRVLDAFSGADLRAVLVLEGIRAYRGRVAPDGWTSDEVVLAEAASPLALPAREGVVRYWIGARGYGWEILEVDHAVGGEREVRLPPAATIEVQVDGPLEGLQLVVRLYPSQEEQAADTGPRRVLAEATPASDGRAVLQGIPAGTYELCAEVGIWSDPPYVLARAPLELVAGDRVQVVLTLDHPLLLAPPGTLTGELVLPAGREELDVVLRILPAGRAPLRSGDSLVLDRSAMAVDPDRPGVLRFDAGALTPGLYAAIVDPLQFHELVDVPAGGRRDVRLVLPELHTVEVMLVDGASDAALALDRIAWGVPTPDAIRTWSYQNVEPGPEPGRFVWLAPAGRIDVTARAPGYQDLGRSLEVVPGGIRERLVMRPLFGARLTFRDGAAVVPASWSHSDLVLRRAGQEQEQELWNGRDYNLQMDDEAHWRVLVPEPGLYLLELPELPGFLRPAAIEVELRAGELLELEVPLQRAP